MIWERPATICTQHSPYKVVNYSTTSEHKGSHTPLCHDWVNSITVHRHTSPPHTFGPDSQHAKGMRGGTAHHSGRCNHSLAHTRTKAAHTHVVAESTHDVSSAYELTGTQHNAVARHITWRHAHDCGIQILVIHLLMQCFGRSDSHHSNRSPFCSCIAEVYTAHCSSTGACIIDLWSFEVGSQPLCRTDKNHGGRSNWNDRGLWRRRSRFKMLPQTCGNKRPENRPLGREGLHSRRRARRSPRSRRKSGRRKAATARAVMMKWKLWRTSFPLSRRRRPARQPSGQHRSRRRQDSSHRCRRRATGPAHRRSAAETKLAPRSNARGGLGSHAPAWPPNSTARQSNEIKRSSAKGSEHTKRCRKQQHRLRPAGWDHGLGPRDRGPHSVA